MPTDYEITNTMLRYGGSFARALAIAAQYADKSNLAKIKATWPDLWEEYAHMWTLAQRRAQERA